MSLFSKIRGIIGSILMIDATSATGVNLKNSSGTLQFRNKADSAFSGITALNLGISTNEGTPRKTTLTMATGGGGDLNFVLPNSAGSASQVLQTDGSGNLSWASAGTTSQCTTVDTTSLAFGSSSPVTMFTLPANAAIEKVRVIVDTAFDGTAPTMSVGISGTTSKYTGTGDVDLKTTGTYEIPVESIPVGTTEDLIITYSADSSAAGAARVQVFYAIPV